MLLDVAIGDAYGAGFEFSPADIVEKHNDLTAYRAHGLGVEPGKYTDDTQMSLAISQLLIDGKEWTSLNIADSFVQCFKRDVRPGYATGFGQFLRSINSGTEFLQKIKPESTRNGACMRSAPIDVLADISQIMEYSLVQAKTTHNSKSGILSSQAVAICAHYFFYNLGSKSDLCEFVNQYTKTQWDNHWQQPVPCSATETVNAIITALETSSCLKSLLIQSVSFSGDVDTVAAVALGIASQSGEYEKNLPGFLYDDLENGEFGRDYLLKIGEKLMSLCQLGT